MIREETVGDAEAIRSVNRAAFGGEVEARLVDLLRENGDVLVSLISFDGASIDGHILFSRVRVLTNAGTTTIAAALAPMAVVPGRQRQGIGSELVRRGLEECRLRGIPFVVVLGHPEYYPRFGFSAERARALTSAYSGAGNAWMAAELTPGALEGFAGEVIYPEAFAVVSAE